MQDPNQPPGGTVSQGVQLAIMSYLWAGIPAAFLCYAVGSFIKPGYGSLFLTLSVVFFGITQFLWLGPALWYKRRQHETQKGIWITAGIAVLLNTSCFALLTTFSKSW